MSEFFKPLRRKLGVVTLMMACVAACGWLRSGVRADFIFFPPFQIVLGHGGVFVEWSPALVRRKTPYGTRDLKYVTDAYHSAEWNSRWQMRRWGFAYGRTYGSNYGVIPYWSIVFPLTVMSAWLLLSKPRVLIAKAKV